MNRRAGPAVHVYCGPTITAAEVLEIIPGATVHPPVRHGDLLRLDARAGDTVAIIDGLFHAVPAVRHKEILDLLARGVRVIGAASMGALRAAELHRYAMIGVGSVFTAYRDGLIDADDEVAVVHADDNQQLSEALADIRALVARAVSDGVLDHAEADRIIDHARRAHYPDRTWAALENAPSADPGIGTLLRRLGTWRVSQGSIKGAKHVDAVAALRLIADGNIQPPAVGGWIAGPWRNFYLEHWIARNRGYATDGAHVPYLALLRHQQLHDPDFPRRWRMHALSWIASTCAQAAPGSMPDIEGAALAAADSKGLALAHLSHAQLAYWLTSDELASLPDPEKLTRLLVRSVAADIAPGIWPATPDDAPGLLNAAIDSVGAVISAFRHNEQVASSAPGRTIYELRADALRSYLAGLWAIDPEDTCALTAAARDRGFHAAAGAIEAARPFLLAARLPAHRDAT